MATSKKFRTSGFQVQDHQVDQLQNFSDLVDNGELQSKRQQCKWLATHTDLRTGDIAAYLQIRYQIVYVYTKDERAKRSVVQAKANNEIDLSGEVDESEVQDMSKVGDFNWDEEIEDDVELGDDDDED